MDRERIDGNRGDIRGDDHWACRMGAQPTRTCGDRACTAGQPGGARQRRVAVIRSMRHCLFLVLAATPILAADDFVEAPEQREDPAVPHGTVTKLPPWESKIFPN